MNICTESGNPALPVCNSLSETHQQAFISAQHSVGEGRTQAVVTGHKAGVQTSRASHYLQQIHAKYILTCGTLYTAACEYPPYL